MKLEDVCISLIKENFELRSILQDAKNDISTCYNSLICIGGPFNDNLNKFTKEQLCELLPILETLEAVKIYLKNFEVI